MRSKKNTSGHDEHKTHSAVLLAAKLQTGAGKHTESKAERNKRTGRLRGNEKRSIRHEED